MKLFVCDHCGNTVYFENALCERCGHQLGYLPDENALISLTHLDGSYVSPAFPGRAFVFCANATHGACNWLVPVEPGGPSFCRACRHNETIPAIDDPVNLLRWQILEQAKKRLFYSLLRLALPLQTRAEDPEHGLSFRFLADLPTAPPVMTGHDNGVITIALAEADDATREHRRTAMGEPYRTLLGHFRHEIGHHYWDLLVGRSEPMLERFRVLFGDERADYGQALQTYYAQGAPVGWPTHYISAYATAHPWEDFAETFAHFLHITDTVEMAAAFGVRARPRTQDEALVITKVDFDPYMEPDMAVIVEHWVPLSLMLNNLNRAIGHLDAYPFVLTPPVVEKLGFINTLVHASPAMAQLVALRRVGG